MPDIAIVGSGPTAIYTACYLISRNLPLRITMFESQAEAGKGTPYHQDWNDRAMLANIASIELPPITENLVSWLECQSDMALARMGLTRDRIDERTFYPRVVLGNYFKSQLGRLMTLAASLGIVFDVKSSNHVLDVQPIESGFKLDIRNRDNVIYSQEFNYVVMATGHAWPQETEVRPGYFLSPWPASALRTIDHCRVGILGTSLSAIDAVVALSVARGAFLRDAAGELHYLPEPGTEAFHITLISRKGLLPEADFYYPIPYMPLHVCTVDAIDRLIASNQFANLIDDVFSLFKAELATADPDYANHIQLTDLTLEQFAEAYFNERAQYDQFVWAEQNLAEAKENYKREYTVQWRYAILRMHEVVARIVPFLFAEDYIRFKKYFKPVFVDDYATVPHESIERLLALHRIGKTDILRAGENYQLDGERPEGGVTLNIEGRHLHYPAFIDATGQHSLSARKFPFPSLWSEGIIQEAAVPYQTVCMGKTAKQDLKIGGIALDHVYHPVSDEGVSSRLYCLSLPFLLGQYPFAQGVTSSHEMGKAVADDLIKHIQLKETHGGEAESYSCMLPKDLLKIRNPTAQL